MAQNRITKKFRLVCFFLLVIILKSVVPGVLASTISVPNALDSLEGNSGSDYPFRWPYVPITVRYQEVYDASQFSQIVQFGWIFKIYYRIDSQYSQQLFGGFNAVLTNVDIRLSTTTRTPNNLSSSFFDNVGSDELIVFSGPLRLSGEFHPSQQPQLWDISVPLSSSFRYSPSRGNLLMEVRVYIGHDDSTVVPSFDASNDANESVSSVYADSVDATSGTTNTLGLVTRFDVAPIPQLQVTIVTNSALITAPIVPNVSFTVQMANSLDPAAVWQPVTNGDYFGSFVRYHFPLSSGISNAYFRMISFPQ